MREIKFRAWDKEKKEMFYNFCISNTGGWFGNDKDDDEDNLFDHYDFDKIEIMQYTGLKDKNGKEVYEGDVVKVLDGTLLLLNRDWIDPKKEEITCQVVFYRGCFVLQTLNINPYYIDLYKDGRYYLEVIGNIYESPELLEGIS
jgi:uncharacterized phage protein (TIGR01671 family)